MVKYDLSSKKLGADYTELDYLYDLIKDKGIRQGDTIKFANDIECTVEFHPAEMAISLNGIKGLKAPKFFKRKECYEYDYQEGTGRGEVGTDFHKIAYELFVMNAEGVLRHGDLLNFSTFRYKNAYFVDIDSTKKIFKLFKNDDPNKSGYAVIPLQISSRVDNAIEYFVNILEENSDAIMYIDPSDKIIDALFHPSLRKYRKNMTVRVHNDAVCVGYDGFVACFYYAYRLFQDANTVKELWKRLPFMTSDESIYESSEYEELHANRKKTRIDESLVYEMIDFNTRFKEVVDESSVPSPSPNKDVSDKEKNQTVTFDKRILAPGVNDLIKDNGLKLAGVSVQLEGDSDMIEETVQQIEGMDFTRDVTKHKCLTPPPGKVLNPETCNFIDAKGALAKKLGLVDNVAPKAPKAPKAKSPKIEKTKEKKEKASKTEESKKSKKSKKIEVDGKVIMFSGFRDAILEEDIKNAGGRVKNNYAKDVTLVVALDVDKKTAKLEKARADDKKIVSKDYFVKRFYD